MVKGKNPKSIKWIILIITLIVLVLVVGGGVVYYLLNPVYIVTGKVTDTDNGKLVKGLKVQANNQESETADDGIYELKNVKKNTAVKYIISPEYEQISPQINYNEFTKINLHTRKINKDLDLNITQDEKVKRVRATIEKIFEDEKFGRFDDLYEELHPDCQALISKEDFIKDRKNFFSTATLVDYKIGDIKFLDKWHFDELNKDYENTAEAETTYVAQYLGMTLNSNNLTHYVKVNGQWKYFWTKK